MGKEISALEAKYEAQKIAFSPIYFQAVVALKKLGILSLIAKNKKGIAVDEIVSQTGVSEYGVKVLLEAAANIDVVEYGDDEVITLTKTGYFLYADKMTEVNLDFVNDVCYEGAKHLTECITTGKPEGLKVFGNWDTVYQGLAHLPQKIKDSWFAFDHYYSDDAFPAALPIVFASKPRHLFDIGGNTGKWTMECCKYDKNVKITIVDLPGQLNVAAQNIKNAGFESRVTFHATDILSASSGLPTGADAVWMSQFLDCFSLDEIVGILKKVAAAASSHTEIFILETFIDNQEYDAAKYCLTGTSLYFTAIANGNSKMYSLKDMAKCVAKAGLVIEETYPLIGNSYHTILKCKKA